jgi:uncharacterized protein (TIGR03086 family)
MNPMQHYRRAQAEFDAVLAVVPADVWDAPSACSAWTVRDVAGHLIWGQEQLRHWAGGTEYTGAPGGPGTPHPALLTGATPLVTWRAARAATDAVLSDAALRRTVTLPGMGERPLSAIVTLLVTDHLAHAWDIAHAIGLDMRLPRNLIAGSLTWARDNVIRAPGLFGPELAPPADADEQARWLAYLGRAAWQPAAAGR